MANLLAFIFLVVLYLAGGWVVDVLALPVPAALPGLLLLFVVLLLTQKLPPALLNVSRVLLGHLAVFFIPATVAVALYWPQLKAHWPVLLVSLIACTGVSLLLTAWVAKRVLSPGEEHGL